MRDVSLLRMAEEPDKKEDSFLSSVAPNRFSLTVQQSLPFPKVELVIGLSRKLRLDNKWLLFLFN